MALTRFQTVLVCTAGLLAAGPAATANALPTGSGSAADTVRELRNRGYHVQLNSNTSAALSDCRVTGVHGLSDSNIDESGHRIDPSQHTTVYVDVVCQPDG